MPKEKIANLKTDPILAYEIDFKVFDQSFWPTTMHIRKKI